MQAQVQFKIALLADNTTYEVSYVPTVDWAVAQTVTNTSQIVISMPTGGFNVTTADITNLKGSWAVGNPIVRTPNESPQMDYIYFNLQSPIVGTPFQSGVAIPVFQFTNSGSCTGAVELMNNDNDPFLPPNSQDINIGQQVGISGAGPGVNAYTRNLDIGGADCSNTDCAILVNEINFTSPTACGVADGTISIVATNGNAIPLQYSINDGNSWENDGEYDGLRAGEEFEIRVRDAIGNCDIDAGILNLEAPLAAAVSPTDITHPSACGASDGEIKINATTENNAPLEYSHDNGSTFQLSDRFTGLGAGTYDLIVRNNSNNCEVSAGQITLVDCEGGPPVGCQVEYQITHQNDGTYVVSLIPEDNYPVPSNQTNGARFTLKVPTGGFQIENLTSLVNGVNFSLGSRYDAPAEDSDFDYINVDLASAGTQAIIYEQDQRTDLFSFENTATCVQDSVGLMDNETDPYAAANNDVGQELLLTGTEPAGLNVCVAASVPKPTHETTLTVNITDESCAENDGVINISSGSNIPIEYSIDNGATWQANGSFPNLVAGDYTVVGREIQHPACMVNFADNPVTVSKPANCEPAACETTFHLELLADGSYQASLTPNFTYGIPLNTTSTINMPVKVPTGGFEVSELTSSIPGVSFAVGGRYNSPSEAPAFDYIVFRLTSQGTRDIFYTQGEKIPLFTFRNSGTCVGGEVQLTENNTDPFSPPNSEQAAIEQQIFVLGYGEDIAACIDNLGSAICTPSGLTTSTHTQTISTTEPTEICLSQYIELDNGIGTVSVDPAVSDVSVGTENGSECVRITPSPDFNSSILFYVLHCDANDSNTCDTTYLSLCPAINAGQDRQICVGTQVQLSATGGTGNFSWSPTDNLSCTDCPNPFASPTISTTYTVTSDDGSGCVSTDEVRVNVLNAPVANFIASDACFGATTNFTDNSSSTRTITAWFWDFDDNGNTSSEQNPSYNFSAAGDYEVIFRVQTQDGCISETTQTVSVGATPTINNVSSTDIDNCETTNGIIEIAATGGANLEYSIDNGGEWFTNSRFTGLGAGDYNILVRESNGTCVATYVQNPVSIQSAGAPTITTPTTAQSVCFGEMLPISITISEDILSYEIMTNGNFANDNADGNTLTFNASATSNTNTFDITLTVEGGCSVTESFVLTRKPVSVASFTASDAACDSGDVTLTFDGTANANATLTWDVGDATVVSSSAATATDPAGAIYVVNWANDGDQIVGLNIEQEGCTNQISQTVSVESANFSISVAATDVSACAATNGAVNLTLTDDPTNYTFSWTGPSAYTSTTQNITGVGAGTYTVVVTHTASGCTAEESATVNSTQTTFTATATTTDITTCGATNGSISLAVDGDPADYTYAWTGDNNFTANTQNIQNLPAGNYNVVVTETASGCSATTSATINAPSTLELVSVNKTDTNGCGESNGTISIEIAGGTAPYTYDLSIGVVLVSEQSNTTSYTFTGVEENTYQVHVTDSNGCAVTEDVTIITDNSNSPQLTITETNDSNCGMGDGNITAQVQNGELPFTYRLFVNNIQVGADIIGDNLLTINDLTARDYRLEVMDGNGCTDEMLFSIQGGNSLSDITISSKDPDCYQQNGLIRLREVPADATVVWYNGNTEIDRDINVLTDIGVGDYRAIIAVNECEIELSATLATEGCLEFTTDTLNITLGYETPTEVCVDMQVESTETPTSVAICGFNNQEINVTETDDSYCFNLSPREEFSGEAEAICVVHCFEDQGVTLCDTTIIMAIVAEPEEEVCDVFIRGMYTNRATCLAANGSARVEINGNPADYSYAWSNGVTGGAEITRVEPGEYYITVTENATQCFVIDTLVVGNIPGPEATLMATDTNCEGADGLITVDIENGTAPYTVNWMGADSGSENNVQGNTFNIPDLPAGNYMVEVLDIYNCSSIMEVSISQPTNSLGVEVGETTSIDCTNENGSAAIEISDFNESYQLALNDQILPDFTNQTTVNLTGLAEGDYTVELIDDSGCSAMATFSIAKQDDLELDENDLEIGATSCDDAADGAIRSLSEKVYTIRNSNGEMVGQTPLTNLLSDTYEVTYEDGGCTATGMVTVENGEGVEIAVSDLDIISSTCGDAADGAIRAFSENIYTVKNSEGTVVGQTPATDLVAGTYTVIYQIDNCSDSTTVTIEAGEGREITDEDVTINSVICNGENNGSIVSTTDENYLVQDSDGNDIGMTPQMNLAAGTYRLVAMDGDCIASREVSIAMPAPLAADIDSRPASCEGDNGSITLSVTGGTGNYTYTWANVLSTSESATGLGVGDDYAVTITDEVGCIIELINLEVTSNCEEVPCEPVFSTNQIELESVDNMTAVCLPVGDTDLSDYESILNGEDVSLIFTQCAEGQSVMLAVPATHELIVIDENSCADTLTIVLTEEEIEENCPNLITDSELNLDTENCASSATYCLPVLDLTDLQITDNGTILTDDFIACADGFALELEIGVHEIIVTNTTDNCADTISINVNQVCEVTRDTLFLDLFVDETKTVCPDTSQLQNLHILTDLDCFDESSGNADFAMNEEDCIDVTGVAGGVDQVCIITCDNTGICDTTILVVTVNEEAIEEPEEDDLIIYTGFSPNGDGVNDLFTIENIEKYPGNRLTVYNRWGLQVFHAKDYTNQNAWDGSFGDFLLPDGGYFYFLKLPDGRTLNGWVNIRR